MTEPEEILIEKKNIYIRKQNKNKNLRDVSVKQIYCPIMGLFLDSYPSYLILV